MAICYRKDLFEKAGLPTDREELAKLWEGDWAKFVEVGRDFQKGAPKDVTFMDSPGGLLNAILSSETEKFYNAEGEVIYKTNPAVKDAFDLTANAAEEGLIGKQVQFQPAWDTTIAIAKAPKSGNWGGSFLSVPKAGKNTDEAAKLAAWLTAPEQQAKLFAVQGSFPSAPSTYEGDKVLSAKNDMTGDAPIGQIFADAAKSSPVQVIGPKDQIIQQGLTDNGVILVTQGKSAADAWSNAVKTIDNNLEK
jgi:cellobiose transport system substrate-binding protein